jgi:hypothetical protein
MSHPGSLFTIVPDPAAAQRTFDALLSAGVRRQDITVISSEPLDRCEFGQAEKATLMPWLVVLGAALGGIGGFLLVSLTSKSYPIMTGGMPITPAWISGIITYELTMLGAILTTLLVLLLTAPLLRWKRDLYDVQVANGKVLVGVNPHESLRENVKKILKACEDEESHNS